MHLHQTIRSRKTGRRRVYPPSDPGMRAARLEKGIERLVAVARAELKGIGVATTGLPDMQIVALAREERRKAKLPRSRTRQSRRRGG
jgi:hypothetical protein